MNDEHRAWAAGICGKDYSPALKGKLLAIGTPTYGGNMATSHGESIESLAFVLGLMGAEFGRFRPQKESLIQRARNRIVREFLAQKRLTHLLFIDGDIEFTPDAPLKLLEVDKPLVCAVYPRKQIEWTRIFGAWRNGYSNPESFASSAVANLLPQDAVDGSVTFDETGCCPILDAATGFMLVRRDLLERMIAAFPETEYVDEADAEQRPMHALFDCFIEVGPNGKKRYLSEDYGFSRRVQKMGETVWLRPDIELNHHGSFCYRGNKDHVVFDDGRALATSDEKAAAK